MSTTDMSPTLDILRFLYTHTPTLEEFANSIVFREGNKAVLIEQSDTNRFKSFVRGVIVCFDKELQQVPSFNQICTLPELLAVVLNSLKRKRKNNILAHGYNLQAQEKRDADPFKFQGDLTQSAAYIHGSDMWKRVTLRLGTDLARYLLESCSVFVEVPPSCVFQLCGTPIYYRVSMSNVTNRFLLKPGSQKNSGAQSGRNQRAVAYKKRRAVEKPTHSKTRNQRNERVMEGKRKRETDQEEEEESLTRSGKRIRVAKQEPTKEIQQVCIEPVEEEQPVSVVPTLSVNPLEKGPTGSKQTVELQTSTMPMEGGPSWRTGMFPSLPPSHCFIRTLGFLYGGRGMRGFILNRKKKSANECRRLQGQDLVRTIFFEGLPYLNGIERKPKKLLPRRFFNMVPLFSQLLRQHRRCPYSRILQRVCPVVGERDAGQGELSSLLSQHCAPHRVFLFVRECLSTVIPQELWGSDHNRLHFFIRVRGFLRSGKFEKLSLSELTWKMKVNDCDWLKLSKTGRFPPSELSYRTQILGQFQAWLLDGYVVGLVRACFYVTESAGQKNALRFYRPDVWAKLQDLAFRVHLSTGQMEEMTPAQVASLPKATVTSRLRFIPKTDSMRPITRVIGADAKTRLYRGRVRDLLDMLRACVRASPSLLGSTVMGMTDIHRVLRSLAPALKKEPQTLYFVKVDVSGAYESLPHDKLSEVIGQALSPVLDELFTVRRYAKIWADGREGLKKSFVRRADFLEDSMGSTNMKGFVTSLQKKRKVHHAILAEQHFCIDLHGRDALQFFTQMLTGSVVQFGKKTYRQCRGIPQGSVVSSLLCCLCYGHMENVLFEGMTEKKGCLMRLVDDFLLITPDLNKAQSFLNILLAGVPQYGLVVNPQKVGVNFQVPGSIVSCPGIRVLPPHCLFPWCGLLLDTHSLDVYKDYSSYAGLSLRYSLTLGSFYSAGQQMRRKLMAVLRLKSHALFLDLKVRKIMNNSLEAVYKNIYKLVLLHACRFHVCAQSLPFDQTVAKSPLYFLRMIFDMAEYSNQLIRLSNKGLILGNKAQTGVLQYEAVELLFCLSFLHVLSQHRPLYRALLPHLHKRKRSLEKCLGVLRLARVRQATNPRTPDDFFAIQC
ncbi:telomerase reverse transcriptase isoform X3 [Gymnodraco acuticeps]|uniref:Telomerase reverse transcriptase n=1 Tax=Gymnodraco acuticeps TaxID=8218 RepID=A0A6P8VXE3_GYMAC|nr:telomerase reverse transcriptase isoform X3 [Gymnodraco acuticeps]